MANVKVTALSSLVAGDTADNDVLPIVDITANATKKLAISDLHRSVPDGTLSAPGIAFQSDLNSGLYRSGTDAIALVTNGAARILVDATGNVTIPNDLTVQGTTTFIDSQTLRIEDKNIELGVVSSPSNTTADGGGITLKGATDKTIQWINSTGAWTFNQPVNMTGGSVCIGGTTITDSNLLNVQGSSASKNIGVVLNDTNTSKIYGMQNTGSNFKVFDYTASQDRFTITSTGDAEFGGQVKADSTSGAFQASRSDGAANHVFRGGTSTSNYTSVITSNGQLTLSGTSGAFQATRSDGSANHIFRAGTSTSNYTTVITAAGTATFGPTSGSYVQLAQNTGVTINDGIIDLYGASTNVNSKLFKVQSDVGGTKVEKVVILAAGNVGIGKTSSLGAKLHIQDDSADETTLIKLRNYKSGVNTQAGILFECSTSGSQGGNSLIKGVCGTDAGGSNSQNDGGLAFQTGSGGSGTLATRLLITSTGAAEFGGTGKFNGHVGIGQAVVSDNQLRVTSDSVYNIVAYSNRSGGAETDHNFTGINASGITSSITKGGAATFASTLTEGGAALNGTAAGVQLYPTGGIHACQASGSSTILSGYIQGSSTKNVAITAAGAATFAGNVGIGETTPNTKLVVKDASNGLTDSVGNINVISSDSAAVDKGGSIGLGGFYNGTSNSIPFANLHGKKENGTDNNASGYFAISTRNASAGTAERMRIDSSGTLLIGGTSTADNDHANIDANGTLTVRRANGTDTAIAIVEDGTVSSRIYADGVFANYNITNALAFVAFDNESGTSGAYAAMGAVNISSGREARITAGSSASDDVALSFVTANGGTEGERMRISGVGQIDTFTSSGFIGIRNAGTSTSNAAIAYLKGATDNTNGTVCFAVRQDGDVENTNNSYGSLSDVKLKENIVDANSQWSDIKSLQVRNYNFKESTGFDTHTQIGVVAQEVETVSPGLVSESPDTDGKGNDLGTTTKSVNYSVLYMKAVKALQEAMERIESLETRIAALES